jgi:hypothetical protein
MELCNKGSLDKHLIKKGGKLEEREVKVIFE